MTEDQRERLLDQLLDPVDGRSPPASHALSEEPLPVELEKQLVSALMARAREPSPRPDVPRREPLLERVAGWLRRRWWAPTLTLAAGAAALSVALLQPPPQPPETSPVGPLRVGMEATSTLDDAVPEAAATVVKARLDQELVIDVRPESAIAGATELHSYLATEDRFLPWRVEWKARGNGRFTLHGPIRELAGLGTAARFTLVFVVGRRDKMPSDGEVERLQRGGKGAGAVDWSLSSRQLWVEVD